MITTEASSLPTNSDDTAATRVGPASICFILIIGLFIVARLWRLTASCLWFDEIFSVHAARHDWSHLFGFVAADIIHPPLFYALLKVWISIGGDSLLWLRLFPVLTSIAVLFPFLLLCRELCLKATEIKLALLFMAVNGYLIKYAQEVRMYSLLLFFGSCSLWLFTRFLKPNAGSKKQLLALSAINLLLVYTHYYGWLLITAETVFLLLWSRDKLPKFLLAVAFLVLCFSPWLYAVTLAATNKSLQQNLGWVTRPGLNELAQFFTLLNEPFYFRQSSHERLFYRWSAFVGLWLFGLPLLVLLWRTVKQNRPDDTQRSHVVRFLLFFFLFPVALAFLLSWVLPHSVWGTRHLTIFALPYFLLAARAFNNLRSVWVRVAVFCVLGCWLFLAGTALLLRRADNYVWCTWEQLAQKMIQQQPGTSDAVKIYAFEDLIAYHLWFALEGNKGKTYNVGVIKGVPGLVEDPAYFLPRSFADIAVLEQSALNEEHLWIAFRDATWDEGRPPLKPLIDRGYEVRTILEAKAQGQRAFLVELRRQ